MPSMDPTTLNNLAALHTLDENTLLEALKGRYDRDIIYTYLGDILVGLNPYKRLAIYSPEFKLKYANIRARGELPPHLYAISDHAYQSMRRSGLNQCCVVSGESGAGKTESTKLIVEHIAQLCNHTETRLHERIVQVNPLLEAFGNALTAMNNNSSRFGKYIEMCFDYQGTVTGAHISEYLLEKSRVVRQGRGERNFHIFYYMFAGLHPEQLQNNMLDRPEQHRIMRTEEGTPIYRSEAEFRYHQQMWDHLREIMDVVGFLPEEVNMILAILAAILHITDITFDTDYDTDGVYIIHEEMLELAAELLAVPPEELAAALISNATVLRGERIVTLKNISQANDGRDALAKALYGRLFGWIVRQINYMLQPDLRYHHRGPCIGILDIAGFENFEVNSLEQLCFNAANEQLQFYFNQHIFQWELDEYKKEGVKGKDVKFVDNRPLLDMILEAPLGIFSLIDEESRFPKSTDASLVDKLAKNIAKKSYFSRPKGQQEAFVINHYAGPVTYTATGFLEKNRDTLSANMMECMKNSESQIIADLFTAPISDTGALQLNPDAPKRSRKSLLLCKPKDLSYTKMRSLSKRAGRKLKEKAQDGPIPIYENALTKTVGNSFKNSLTELMAKLLDAEPQFVRCIKPNTEKKPGVLVAKFVVEQLRYTGVLETVRIRRLGYATRLPHALFFDRYRILHFPLTVRVEPTPANCTKLLKKCGLKEWEMGKTKVFLKYWHTEQLNQAMDVYHWKVLLCQRVVRGFIARRMFRSMFELSRQDRAAVRGFSVYIVNASDERYNLLVGQQEHDVQRLEQMKRDQKDRAKAQARHAIATPADRPAQSSIRHPQQPSAPPQQDFYNHPPQQHIYNQIPPQQPIYSQPPPPRPLYNQAPPPQPMYNQAPPASSPMYNQAPPASSPMYNQAPPASSPMYNQAPPPSSPIYNQAPPQQQQPAVNTAQKRFIATPIVLGNPVYGNPNPILNDPNRKFGDSKPRFIKRRPSVEADQPSPSYEYPTDTMLKSPVKQKGFDYNSTSHYARPQPVSQIGFFESIIEETAQKLPALDPGVWGKIYYMEKDRVLGKVYVKHHEVIVDNSSQEYDGYVVGLGAFQNSQRDHGNEKIKKQISKGVKISVDSEGNIYAAKLSKCDVIVKGYKDPQQHSISAEVVEGLGRLRTQPMKIFDMKVFKSHLSNDFRKSILDPLRVQRLCITSFAFVRNTFEDLETPCWLAIVNFVAMKQLGQDTLFQEIHQLAQIRLGDAEEVQLRRNWAQLQLQMSDDPYSAGTEAMRSQSRQSRVDSLDGSVISQGPPARDGSPGYSGSIRGDDAGNYALHRFPAPSVDAATLSPPVAAKPSRQWAKRNNPEVLY